MADCPLQLEPLEERNAAYNIVGPWSSPDITYSFVGGANTPELRSAVEAGFRLWANYAEIHVSEVADAGPDLPLGQDYPSAGLPMIRIHSSDDIKLPALAGTYYPLGNSARDGLAGDIFFGPNIQAGNLKEVVAHEIGHALGMAHSSTHEALMHPDVGDWGGKLTPDDVGGIVALYGVGFGTVTPLPAPPAPPAGTPGTSDVPGKTPTFPQAGPPATPFANFSGDVLRASADFNRDGVLDHIFTAQGSDLGAGVQGHTKVFDGVTGQEIFSQLAFPGFAGRVAMSASDGLIAVTAQSAQGHTVSFGEKAQTPFLAFAGYQGEVALRLQGDSIVVTALTTGAEHHEKVFAHGQEVASNFTIGVSLKG